MVCISTGSYENRVSKHFAISLNFPCLIAALLSSVCLCLFFVRFVVRNLCRSGCKQNFPNFFLHPPYPPPLHSLPLFFFSLLSTILYSIQVTASYPSQFALSELPEEAWNRIFPTSLTGDVTSEIAEDNWERGCSSDSYLKCVP